MSFNHSTPQSLPQDYAILSHYNTSALSEQEDHNTDNFMAMDTPYAHPRASPSVERAQPPTPPIPRIHESAEENDHLAAPERITTSQMFREELGILTRYSLPVFGTHLLEYSFILASVVSIASYKVSQPHSTPFCPPAWTSDRPYMVGLWTQRMMLMTALVLIPITAIWLNAEPILLALNQEPEVARLAGLYLRCASLAFLLIASTSAHWYFGAENLRPPTSRRYFQSQGLFDVPTRIIVVVAPINVFLNWLFVHPLGLSFPGAPLATSLSFNLVAASSLLYGYFITPRTAWSPITRKSLNPVTGEMWKGWSLLARLGIAGVGQTASEWWSWELIGLAASQLGPVALATQSVLLLSASCTYQAPFALSIATSVRIGNLLGQGNARRAGLAAKTALVMAVGIAGVWSALFLTFRNKWAYLFNDDPEVISLVASILPLVALFQVFDGTSAITGGIFRARGKQASRTSLPHVAGALLNLSAYYALGIPLGLYLAFLCHHALTGLWEGLTVALVYCSGVGIWTGVRDVRWEEEVARAKARVGGKEGESNDAEGRGQ
ncbi:MATE efflux family protein [Melanogaster broomeanus]|nr:MATE efflux family protein [Melanogaster broomeanus]